ncbi:MFS transporter [Paenibacillus sp. GSMTC-2017]|uniref:MDR family MFS transporter n=1 Tax=Paenibacillus sp. GSMTC-2017 TaxID=2794350 RepID=UPI0018D6175C|nr:MFS transporter [Paenibacillus sp. GSMTC-2017]MBH5320414.1 MFS transporter [Paenibacillus sp. GSMTC-2017]
MIRRLQSFKNDFHPIVNVLLVGTVFARIASSMSLPFLAIYLFKYTDMSGVMIGFTIGIGSLAGMFGGFFGGYLSDRFGRRIVMQAAIYLWAIVFIGFAFAEVPIIFALLNALNGLCRSFYEPVSQALMADLTKKEKRYAVYSLRYMAINIGVAVGPLLGTIIAGMNGRLPWIITGCIYLAYGIVLHFLLNKYGIRSIEGEKKNPVSIAESWGVIRKDAAFRFFIIGGIVSAIGYAQMTSTLSQFIGQNYEQGVTLFAWMMSINAIVVVALQIPFSKWAEKRSPLTAIVVGSICYAIGNLGYAFSNSWWILIVSMIVFTLGEILTFPAGAVMLDRLAPEEMRGTYFGAQTFTNLGFFLGPWLGGFLLQGYGGQTLFIVIAIISLVSVWFYRLGEMKAPLAKQKSTGISA